MTDSLPFEWWPAIYYTIVAVAVYYLAWEAYGWLTAKSLKGEVVLITGGGSGIGRSLALRCARDGAIIVIWDLNLDAAAAVVEEIESEGGAAYAYKIDVTNRRAVYALASAVAQEVGHVTILVNNAGIVAGGNFLSVSDERAELTMNVNTIAHFWTVKAFLPRMIEENKGHIVTIASAAGVSGVAGLADYNASKFGAIGFTEGLRMDLRKMGSNVVTTTINPYYINTGMFEGVTSRFSFLLPILEQEYVSERIRKAIVRNEPFVCLPYLLNWMYFVRGLLPTSWFDTFAEFMGASASMDDFVGRKNN